MYLYLRYYFPMQSTLFTFEPAQPQKKQRTLKFYEDVKKEYIRLCSIKKAGKRLYSDEYILHLCSEKFYRSERTIENIVFNRL